MVATGTQSLEDEGIIIVEVILLSGWCYVGASGV